MKNSIPDVPLNQRRLSYRTGCGAQTQQGSSWLPHWSFENESANAHTASGNLVPPPSLLLDLHRCQQNLHPPPIWRALSPCDATWCVLCAQACRQDPASLYIIFFVELKGVCSVSECVSLCVQNFTDRDTRRFHGRSFLEARICTHRTTSGAGTGQGTSVRG